MEGFFTAVRAALDATDVDHKRQLVGLLPLTVNDEQIKDEHRVMAGQLTAGSPERPELVHPAQVKKRRLNSLNGRVALIHAVAHIEFNAINLALDAVWRFRGLPAEYYCDWLGVAHDELRHFGWLQDRLLGLGVNYGDLPAHSGLWDAAVKTADDPVHRMALVPRVLEARGLDVTPSMIKRLRAIGDDETVFILENILREEVAHVEAGSRWYAYLCEQHGLDAEKLFPKLLERYSHSLPRGPFNYAARSAAGFTETEIKWLASLDAA